MTDTVDEVAVQARLVAALRALGLAAGDVAYLGIDLAGVSLPRWPAPRSGEAMREHRGRVCAFVHDAVRTVIGPEGTICAPAFSYDYARRGQPYEHETAPAEVGPFTEWFRQRPGTIRSFHPLFSVCGAGPAASAILENTGRSAFGAVSPFGRLAQHKTRFVSLGVAFARWFTYAHHLEQIAGVNHAYHKVFTVPARRNGVDVPEPFLAFVRYLGAGIDIELTRFEQKLRDDGALRESRGDAGFLQVVDVADVDRVGLAMLSADPWAFTAAPVEVHIDVPGAAPQPDRAARTVRFGPLVKA
jgi:aminoglycoside 3-N-acetyltransferase